MSSHDKYRVLCAISTSHSLTPEEQLALDEHLAVCDECRQLSAEYEALATTAMPALTADFHEADFSEEGCFVPTDWSVKEAKGEFFRRLDRRHKLQAAHALRALPQHSSKRYSWKFWPADTRSLLPYAAGLAAMLAVGSVGYKLGNRQATESHGAPARVQLAVAGLPGSAPDSKQLALLQSELDDRDRSIASLNEHINHRLAEILELKSQERNVSESFRESQSRNAQTASERDDLERKLEQAQSDLATIQKEMESLRHQRAEQALHLADLEAQSAKFPAMLRERDETIAQQRELLDRDRDIRDLMGARQLYVGEVTDVGRDGKTKKPFARVFYTKGKSLIFYAYDLDQQPHVRETSTFQAWGHRGPDLSQATSLGIFYADNTANKRWVVKFDDAKSLEQIDAVFVTVEPKGGSRKPSSAGFLFTYLGVEPNHP